MSRDYRLINYMGSNATGKSTRMYHLVKYLMENFNHEVLEYPVIRSKKGQQTTKDEEVGFIFENGWFVFGKFVKDGTQWASLDTAIHSKWEYRHAFLKDLCDNYPEVQTVFMEGYFNNGGKNTSSERMRENGFTEVHTYVSFYDSIDEFIERTNGRTGRERGLDWAENSAGWKDNAGFKKLFDERNGKENPPDKIVRIPIDAPKDYFVREYFGDTFEIKSTKEKEEALEEWL